jgi:hypothetical protein
MRKYLIATVVGALLVASQAVAQASYSDTAMVSLGDRLGVPSGSRLKDMDRNQELILLAAGAAVIGIIAWGFSQNGHTPESP